VYRFQIFHGAFSIFTKENKIQVMLESFPVPLGCKTSVCHCAATEDQNICGKHVIYNYNADVSMLRYVYLLRRIYWGDHGIWLSMRKSAYGSTVNIVAMLMEHPIKVAQKKRANSTELY
jgi:hypothetical protein